MTANKPPYAAKSLLLACLKTPGEAASYNNQQWSLLIRTAKACKLSAHIGWLIEQQNIDTALPEKVQNHFAAAKKIAEFRQRQALWELNRLRRALADLPVTVIVLKGGAYLLAGLPFASARLLSDVDIMVEKPAIELIEQTLLSQNWQSMKIDDYDQQYYRQWMHEIPPLRHILRAIEVDIHHTIIPPTSRLKPDPALFFHDAVSIEGETFKVLSPCDMVLHSAVHLFFDSDLSNKLRDLVDLDQLLRHFYAQYPDFLAELLARAAVLGLQRPLYYTLRYSHQFLNTPLSNDQWQTLKAIAPPLIIRWLMDLLVPLALLPEHPDRPSKLVSLARWLLYVRSHWLKMPVYLMVPHLLRKAFRRVLGKEQH